MGQGVNTNSWYRVTLTAQQVIASRDIQLERAFTRLFLMNQGPVDAGMFNGLKFPAIGDYFFSPGAAAIALPLIRSYSGVECPPPKRSEVVTIVVHYGRDEIPFAPEEPDSEIARGTSTGS